MSEGEDTLRYPCQLGELTNVFSCFTSQVGLFYGGQWMSVVSQYAKRHAINAHDYDNGCSTDRRRTAPVTKKPKDLECPLCDRRQFKLGRISVACQIARGSRLNTIDLGRGPDIEAQRDGEATARTQQRQQSRTTYTSRRGGKHDLAHTGEQRRPITGGFVDRDHCAARPRAEVDDFSGRPNVLRPIFLEMPPAPL